MGPLVAAVVILVAVLARAAFAPAADAASLAPRAGVHAFVAINERTGQRLEEGPLFGNVALTPGVPATASIRVRNTGDLPLAVRLRATPESSAAAANPMWDPSLGLQAEVLRADGSLAYRGPLADLDADLRAALGPADEEMVRVAVWLPARVDAASLGRSASTALSVLASQVR